MVIGIFWGFMWMFVGHSKAEEVDLEQAKALYNNGKMLFEEERYANAIESWEKSWDISQEPILLYNIALAYEEMEKFSESIEYLYKYRSYASADEQLFLKEKIEELTSLQEEKTRLTKEREEQEQKQQNPVEPVQEDLFEESKIDPFSKPSIPTVEESLPKKEWDKGEIAMYASLSSTAILVGASSYGRSRFLSSKDELQSSSDCTVLSNNNAEQYWCTRNADQLIEQNLRLGSWTNVGWSLSILSGGMSVLLTIRHFEKTKADTTTSLRLSPSMILVEGRF